MLLAFINSADKLHSIAAELFRRVMLSKLQASVASSALLELELLMRTRRYPEAEIREVLRAFKAIPNLGEEALSSDVMVLASELRERYHLTFFDSLHAATAILSDKQIISTDEAYGRLTPEGLIWLRPEELLR